MADITKATKSSTPGSSTRSDSLAEIYEYYDAGNHWCKNCNITSGSMFDFFTHLHSKMHRKTLDPYVRPWASNSEREKKRPTGELISKPAKGSEFVLPVRGFFCQLCKEFFGDPICAEAHVICHAHNEKYKKQMYENPLYEQRRNLDRQAGMESEKKQNEHKRKRDDDDSQDEQKNSKSSKDQVKKPKCKTEEEDRSKHIKEEGRKVKYIKEEENKPKCKKEEVERTKSRKEEEEERTRYTKEDGERNKFQEEERCRQKKADEERYKAEEDKYRYKEENRSKCRDDDKSRYKKEDEKSRYRKEDDKKYKSSHDAEEDRRPKHKEEEGLNLPKSKWEEEEEENDERPKSEKEDKKQQQKGSRKDEKEKSSLKDAKIDPEKPSEPPKVFCGPSPAMLAKLRKKNEEATSRPTLGKFTWKKPEKTALEKEAEKIAEQFIKEDEESVSAASKDSEDQDAFAKSMAAAKSIAIKLSGKTAIAPSQDWVAYNQVKIRPNLPTPSNILKKSNVGPQNKSVSADPTSLAVPTVDTSSKSSETEMIKQAENEDVLPADLISKAFDGEEVQLEIPGDNSSSLASASVSVPTTSTVTTPSSTVQEVEAVEVKAPPECIITLESDVAAPGVPEEEHKQTVVVRPPPQIQTFSSYSSKPDKPKTNLAAAKAKDLFDIFYGNSTLATCSGSSAGNKVGCKQDSQADSGSLVTTLDNELTTEQAPDSGHLADVSSLKDEEPSEDRGEQSEPPTFDLEVEPLMDSTEEHSGSMEMATVDCKNEADSLDCLANSEIMENIEMMGTNDDQNPLDSEEAMTLSFSPPPGSFTEQLNLDTFEFSFDSL